MMTAESIYIDRQCTARETSTTKLSMRSNVPAIQRSPFGLVPPSSSRRGYRIARKREPAADLSLFHGELWPLMSTVLSIQ